MVIVTTQEALRSSGLFRAQPREVVVANLVERTLCELEAHDDAAWFHALEDLLFHERKRLTKRTSPTQEHERLDALGQAMLRGGRPAQRQAIRGILTAWAEEIHGTFDPRAHAFAVRWFPPALGGLLGRPRGLWNWNLDPARRIQIDGNLELLRQLADEATIILAPTHVSNLDSPLLGLSLVRAGLPPFQYGAGLNLFSNPVLGWWMSRLGAYTVDRTKQSGLYKRTLKNYSILQLQDRNHSLFFPGGTRSRSGAMERRLKKGLLGTGIAAWQSMLSQGRAQPDVYVVPVTLSFQLVLEANTLIQDHLEEAGRQRYIISDDEFTQPRRLLEFGRRVLSMDASCVVRFGHPLDVLGNPVPAERSAREDASLRRRAYVCGRDGRVQPDPQRDRQYTDRLATSLVSAYPALSTEMSTHVVAWAAWTALEAQLQTTDVFRVLRSSNAQRHVPMAAFMACLTRGLDQLHAGARQRQWHVALPDTPKRVLAEALDRFVDGYHRSNAIERTSDGIVLSDPRLCLYYRNRSNLSEGRTP